MRIVSKLFMLLSLISFCARGFNPGDLGADSAIAFYETESSFGLPGYETLSEIEPGLPETLISMSFTMEEDPRKRSRGLIKEGDNIGEYSYTEVSGDAGADDLHVEVFTGVEVNKFDLLARYSEYDYYGDELPINIHSREGRFGAMYSIDAGSIIGVNAQYMARRDVPSSAFKGYDKTDIDSGRFDLEFIGDIWDDTKLTSQFGGIYSVYRTDISRYRDSRLSVDLGFNSFFWADNLSRANLSIVQDILNIDDGRSVDTLYGDISFTNDIPLTDWMTVGIGFTRYMHQAESLISRNYASGILHFQIGRRTGLYIQYSPKLLIPTFQELYLENQYTRISEIPLILDTYFSIETGVTERLSRNLTAGINIYQTRSRRYPVMSDNTGDRGLEYSDAGRVQINGGTAEYTLDLFNFVSNSGYYSLEEAVVESTGTVVPYIPRDKAGISLRLYYNDRISVETAFKRLGRRSYLPGIFLPAVHTFDIRGSVKLIDGLEVYLRGDNIVDREYELMRGIPAPGRALSLGAQLIL